VTEKQVSEYLKRSMKIVEHIINIILQHYDRPAHHSHKTTAAYGDENGFSSSC